jgi:hypothetical protein
MNESSNQSRLTAYGWDRLEFSIDNEIFDVPNDSILRELMGSPILDKPFIIKILYQYDLTRETAIKIKSILDRDNLDTFWHEVMEVVNEDKNIDQTRIKTYEQLYVILSLQTHRIDRQLQSQDDKSISIFKEFHNLAVKNIQHDLQNPFPSDLITENFCKEEDADYNFFKYHESITTYFWSMLPQPFSSIPLYEKDSKWNDYTRSTLKKKMINPDDKLLWPTDENLARHEEKRKDAERRMCAFFQTYREAKEHVASFSIFRYENCPDFLAKWLDENDKKPSRNLSVQRRLRKEGMIERVLCRCQFCTDYRALPRKAGKFTWHCEEQKLDKRS